MVRQTRSLLTVAVLMTLGKVGAAPCRAQELPPAPLPVVASTPSNPAPPPNPPPTTAPPPPPPVTVSPPITIVPPPDFYDEDFNNLPPRRITPLDSPVAPPGLFAAFEADIVGAHFKNRLTAPVDLNGLTDQLHVPGADLDWTGAPRVELGYRFVGGLGEVLVSYRALSTEGTGTLPNFDIDGSSGFLKSRLDMNVVDFDFARRTDGLGAYWDLKWKAGVRWASVIYDSQADGPFSSQYVKNDFLGAGPHAGFDVWRRFPAAPGLELFARLESAAVIGSIRQRFEESVAVNDLFVGGLTEVRHTQVAPVVNVQTGLSWTPPGFRHMRFSGGYEFESWWYLGHAGDSRGDLTDQGVFLRAEFQY
jgi:hypothetical protein